MREALNTDEIEDRLSDLDGWSFGDDSLLKEFSFTNFREAIAFLLKVSFEAEELFHHPEIFNVYNTVKLTLRTHDAGNKVSDLDFQLARAIDALSADQ